MFEELPPEISGMYELSLSPDLRDPCKDLFPLKRSLNLCLGIPDHVVSVFSDPTDAVHYILAVHPLIEDYISPLQLTVRSCEIDIISAMYQKWRHTVARYEKGYHLSLIGKLPQNRDIFPCIDNSFYHNSVSPVFQNLSEIHGHTAGFLFT